MSDASSGSLGRAGYLQVLRIPGAAAFSAAGALARLPQAMVGLGSVLLVTGLGGSYTLGGLVAGAASLSQGVVSPQLSGLADRLGQARVLLPLLVAHVAALATLLLAATVDAPAWALVCLGAGVGSSMPQVGAFARARWTALLTDDDPRIDTALAVESLIDEAVFIVGPVLVTVLATAVSPAAGLLTALALVVVGCSLFLSRRDTEPVPHPSSSVHRGRGAIRHPGLLVLVVVFFAIGVLFGLIEVGVVALARESGHPTAAGAMLGLWATGSLLAGLGYGARRWRAPARRRFLLGVAAMAAGTVLVAAGSGSLVLLTVALVVAGLANAPTLITGNTLVPGVVPPSALTEAYTWLSVTVFAGIAVGSPTGGSLIDHHGARAALWASTAAGAIALVAAVAGQRVLTSEASAKPH